MGALRFTPGAGAPEELVCPPYDIISEEQRREYLARNPRNIIRLELPREGEDPYRTAGEVLGAWLEEGILACDASEGLYIYEERFNIRGEKLSVKGLTGRVRLEEFSAGVVLPHEETLSKAKDDRFRLMCATGCNFSSIYSLYFDEEGQIYPRIEELSAGEPMQCFTDGEGVEHRVWRVGDPAEVRALCAAFAGKKLYIADGHHRYETGLRYKAHLKEQGLLTGDDHPGNYIMMTLVHMEHPGLVVFPTHRIVRDLPGFDRDKLLKGCEAYFEISACPLEEAESRLAGLLRQGEKALALYTPGACSLLRLRDASVMAELLADTSDAYRQLDVNILHILILERMLGIDKANMANQKNLTYTRDAAEAAAAVDGGSANCAFLLNPTLVSEIANVAGAGEKMPQKSTYFYPKLITGHVMNQIISQYELL